MGQKINPTGFRVGIYGEHKGWKSRWYANKANYGKLLGEDYRIRKHVKSNYKFGGIPFIEIERQATSSKITVFIHAARPGLLIGKKGAKLTELEAALRKITGKDVNVQIKEVKEPATSAQLLAEGTAEMLGKRSSFRRAIKNTLKDAKEAGSFGCRVRLSGRLGGADMSRLEQSHYGSIPLHTIGADIDYGFAEAKTNFGIIGVKVWLYRGMLKGAPELK